MTPIEFRRRLASTGIDITSATGRALERIYVAGDTAYRVSMETGIDQSSLSRAKARFESVEPVTHCPHCAQKIS